MRPFLTIAAVSALGIAPVLAQHNNPPLLTPMPPIVQPPPPVAPPPVPSVVTPLRSPTYGVPPNISTATPLSVSPHVVYRQPADPPRKKRFRKRHTYGSSR